MAWKDLCKVSQLVDGEGKCVDLGDKQLAVFVQEGRIYAFQDRCPHAGASLSGGYIDEGAITCPWHYWTFKLDDGSMVGGGRARIKIYSTRVVGEGADANVQADV